MNYICLLMKFMSSKCLREQANHIHDEGGREIKRDVCLKFIRIWNWYMYLSLFNCFRPVFLEALQIWKNGFKLLTKFYFIQLLHGILSTFFFVFVSLKFLFPNLKTFIKSPYFFWKGKHGNKVHYFRSYWLLIWCKALRDTW